MGEKSKQESEEDVPQQEIQEEYTLEQSKIDSENIDRDFREGKIDISESIRRRKELIEKMAKLKENSKKEDLKTAERLKKAVDNFNDVINREV